MTDYTLNINWRNQYSEDERWYSTVLQNNVPGDSIGLDTTYLNYQKRDSGVVEREDIIPEGYFYALSLGQTFGHTEGRFLKIYLQYNTSHQLVLYINAPPPTVYDTTNRYCDLVLNYRYISGSTTVQVSNSYYINIIDAWGPTIYCFRRNGAPQTSETISTVTVPEPSGNGSAEIHDFGSYYYMIYSFNKYKDKYKTVIYAKDMTYTNHTLAGWTKGTYDPSTGQISVSGYGYDYSLDGAEFEYKELVVAGGLWRENSCPANLRGRWGGEWEMGLGIRVINNNTWVEPLAIYYYKDGQGWIQIAPTS